MNSEWFEDIRTHIPVASYEPTHFNFGGLFREPSFDERKGALVWKPKPYSLLEALPELYELSMRYQFKVSVGDQIKKPYVVGSEYREQFSGLVELYGFGVTRGDCELRLIPTHETFDLVRAAAKRALRKNFPGYTPAQIEARLR